MTSITQAAIFDLDETLLDRATSLAGFLNDQHARFRERLGNPPLDRWRERFLFLDKRSYVHKSVVYPKLLSEFESDPTLADVLLRDYRENCARHAQAFDGVTDLLTTLWKIGIRTGIITNGETDFQTRHITALGLDKLVNAILISETENLRKPDKAIFRRAAERLGVAAENCLFVGDNPETDILGAHNAGMKVAWLRGNQTWPEGLPPNPGLTIEHLLALKDVWPATSSY